MESAVLDVWLETEGVVPLSSWTQQRIRDKACGEFLVDTRTRLREVIKGASSCARNFVYAVVALQGKPGARLLRLGCSASTPPVPIDVFWSSSSDVCLTIFTVQYIIHFSLYDQYQHILPLFIVMQCLVARQLMSIHHQEPGED